LSCAKIIAAARLKSYFFFRTHSSGLLSRKLPCPQAGPHGNPLPRVERCRQWRPSPTIRTIAFGLPSVRITLPFFPALRAAIFPCATFWCARVRPSPFRRHRLCAVASRSPGGAAKHWNPVEFAVVLFSEPSDSSSHGPLVFPSRLARWRRSSPSSMQCALDLVVIVPRSASFAALHPAPGPVRPRFTIGQPSKTPWADFHPWCFPALREPASSTDIPNPLDGPVFRHVAGWIAFPPSPLVWPSHTQLSARITGATERSGFLRNVFSGSTSGARTSPPVSEILRPAPFGPPECWAKARECSTRPTHGRLKKPRCCRPLSEGCGHLAGLAGFQTDGSGSETNRDGMRQCRQVCRRARLRPLCTRGFGRNLLAPTLDYFSRWLPHRLLRNPDNDGSPAAV